METYDNVSFVPVFWVDNRYFKMNHILFHLQITHFISFFLFWNNRRGNAFFCVILYNKKANFIPFKKNNQNQVNLSIMESKKNIQVLRFQCSNFQILLQRISLIKFKHLRIIRSNSLSYIMNRLDQTYAYLYGLSKYRTWLDDW